MPIAISGSIATDHLMRFPGRFSEQLLADQLDRVSLSFLVDDLVVRYGGVAANIAYGMARLGLRPILVGAVGPDFAGYQEWLESAGVDCSAVLVSQTRQTARFVCTTDDDECQIASFYAGAMAEAGDIELLGLVDRSGRPDLFLIGPDDPGAMLRHTEECRRHGYPFAADPSQQLARMSGAEIGRLVDGAAYLFTNEYESELLATKTGLSEPQLLDRVGVRVTTRGRDGVRITGRHAATIDVPIARSVPVVDPTGVGDGFRAGFLAAVSWGLDLRHAAQVGSMLASYVLTSSGTQDYEFEPAEFVRLLSAAYGPDAAAEVRPHLLAAVG